MKTNINQTADKTQTKVLVMDVSEAKAKQISLLSSVTLLVLLVVLIISATSGIA